MYLFATPTWTSEGVLSSPSQWASQPIFLSQLVRSPTTAVCPPINRALPLALSTTERSSTRTSTASKQIKAITCSVHTQMLKASFTHLRINLSLNKTIRATSSRTNSSFILNLSITTATWGKTMLTSSSIKHSCRCGNSRMNRWGCLQPW